jgi:AcrR family transcriptional regulator
MIKDNKRGRPSDPALQHKRKEQLMDTAYQLLNQKSYRAITIREIAEQAGMKSAMISYYFTNKEGLFTALIARYAATNSTQFEAILKSPEPVKTFIKKAIVHFSENPALSRLIADEVLSQQSDLGEKFLNIIPKKIAIFLPSLIKAEQKAGRIRAELDPKWAAFSLMSMIVMPFIGAPAREKAWGISNQEIISDAWIDQLYKLYMVGCKAQ